jgi:hypothetical protein
MSLRLLIRLVAGLLLLAPAAHAEPAVRGAEFFEVVAARFAHWDANHDGRLSVVEVDRLVADPKIKGKEAAAVAALARTVHGDKVKPPAGGLTREYLGADRPGHTFAKWFAAGVRHLATTDRTLFRPGDPSLHAFRQGPIGDCFVLAPLGAAVARDPAAVRRMIRDRPDGSYRVALGNGTVLDVPAPTDAEIALTAGSAGHGLWINVFEKAFAAYRARKPGKLGAGVDAIAHGGPTGQTLAAITGHPVRAVQIRKDSEPPPAGMVRTEVAGRIDRLLREAVAGRRLACASSAAKQSTPGLTRNHAYAVLGYDPAHREVRLWNPHGNTFQPKGPAGLANGYPTKDGFFSMPLDDLVQTFRAVYAEGSPG